MRMKNRKGWCNGRKAKATSLGWEGNARGSYGVGRVTSQDKEGNGVSGYFLRKPTESGGGGEKARILAGASGYC